MQTMVPLYGFGGGGGTGAALTVNAPAGATVSVGMLTTHGAQLFNINDKKKFTNCNVIADDIINIDFDNSGNTSTSTWANYFTNVSSLLKPSTTYTIITEVFECSGLLRISPVDVVPDGAKSQFANSIEINNPSVGVYVGKATTRDSFDGCATMCRGFAELDFDSVVKAKFRISVIDDTNITADTFTYRPFTGGKFVNYSKFKIAGDDGVVVFKGLASGEWTISITDGEQTAQKTVTITADYSTAITFFAATIHITYPAGSVCTATDGATTLQAPDTSGTWDCVVPNAGTWTVSVSGRDWTESVEITGNNQSAQVDISKYYLYRNGNEYVSRTGGWTTNNYVSGQYTAGTLNRNVDNMEMIASSSANQNVILRTTQKINLTNIKELTINVISRSGAENAAGYIGAYLYIKASALVGEYPAQEIAFVGLSGTGLFSVDVSAITGEYYVVVSCYGASIKFNQVGAAV